MGPYSSGDKSIKISYYFQEKDKEQDSKELPFSPLQDLYWPSRFHELTFTFLSSPTTCSTFMTPIETEYIYIYIYIPIFYFKYTVIIHKMYSIFSINTYCKKVKKNYLYIVFRLCVIYLA